MPTLKKIVQQKRRAIKQKKVSPNSDRGRRGATTTKVYSNNYGFVFSHFRLGTHKHKSHTRTLFLFCIRICLVSFFGLSSLFHSQGIRVGSGIITS